MRVPSRLYLIKWRRPVTGACDDEVSIWPVVAVGAAMVGLYWWSKHRGVTEESYGSLEDFESLCHLQNVPASRLSQMALPATRYNHCYDVPLLIQFKGTRRTDGKQVTLTKYRSAAMSDVEKHRESSERLLERKLTPLLVELPPEEQQAIVVQVKRWRERLFWASREYHSRWSMRYFLDVWADGPASPYREIAIVDSDWHSLQQRWHNEVEERLDTSQTIDITVKYRARWLPDFVSWFE